jgi:hypothetical protein
MEKFMKKRFAAATGVAVLLIAPALQNISLANDIASKAASQDIARIPDADRPRSSTTQH